MMLNPTMEQERPLLDHEVDDWARYLARGLAAELRFMFDEVDAIRRTN